MLTFAFIHHPYLVCILFGMPSLHLFTFLMFLLSCLFYAILLSAVKVSIEKADSPHQRWIHQLLRGSALLSRPSTLKFVSLPLASGTSLRLTLADASGLDSTPHRQMTIALSEGRRNRERNCPIPIISPPTFSTKVKVAKGGGGGGGGGGAYLRDTTVVEIDGTFLHHYFLSSK